MVGAFLGTSSAGTSTVILVFFFVAAADDRELLLVVPAEDGLPRFFRLDDAGVVIDTWVAVDSEDPASSSPAACAFWFACCRAFLYRVFISYLSIQARAQAFL